ncbi:DUF2642 domain-containing protein [Paenibacillus thailandensis]|jgi:hypothetical protein|uniref:DUF2642 domain-containing protein n=1 Tax=Paenibacillus thailandensis TaxID=393250 RepID=A0ABW5QT88_9BACL
MKNHHPFFDKTVELYISEHETPIRGKLAEIGQDIFVILSGGKYVYVPINHLQQLRLVTEEADERAERSDNQLDMNNEPVSYRKTLMNAKGMFSEIFITGNQTIHGYLTSVMNDFFVFYSPVYHTVIVSLQHLKYLIPYQPNATPYMLTAEQFPLRPSAISLARTFDAQLRKLTGEFVIFDLGANPNKIGVLQSVEGNIAEIVNAAGKSVYVHLDHIKTVHIP